MGAILFGTIPAGTVHAGPIRTSKNADMHAWAGYREEVRLHFREVAAGVISGEQLSASSFPDVSGPGVPVWERYVLHDPAYWLSHPAPAITQAVRSWMMSTVSEAVPTADPMTAYLLWRRGEDPSRFDFYHPKLGPGLQGLIPTPTSTVATTSTAPLTPPQAQLPAIPPSSTSIPASSPPSSVPPAIPEPSTATIALALIASVATWRRLR